MFTEARLPAGRLLPMSRSTAAPTQSLQSLDLVVREELITALHVPKTTGARADARNLCLARRLVVGQPGRLERDAVSVGQSRFVPDRNG